MNNIRKLNILMVHNFYQISGGEDTVFNNEKKLLESKGCNVVTYTRHNNELKKYNLFKKIMYPLNALFSLQTYNDVKKNIINNKIDIVHVHNTWPLISPSVYYAALRSNIPVIQTVHNFRLICPSGTLTHNGKIFEDSLYKGLGSSIKNKVYKGSLIHTLISAAILKFHRVIGTYKKVNFIFLTQFNKNKHLELNNNGFLIIDEKKAFVRPNYTIINKNCISFGKRKDQFVYVGRLDDLKGVKLLLEAWEEIEELELIICGSGPDEEKYKKIIQDKKLSNVHILGLVSNEYVKKIIAESRALILPTQWYEGFPMTIIESFSVGTPVIGSDIGNVGNIIEDGVTGVKFKYNSVVSLRDVVLKFGELNEEKIRENTYEACLKNYSDINNYEVLINIYQKILNRT